MNWISKKVILSQVKKYFVLESDDQVEVEITGQRRLRCSNLKLKQQVINSPSLPVTFQHLFIKELHLSYDSSEQEPLKVLLEGITLVLKFNPNQQRQPPEYSSNQQNIKAFTEAIQSKEGLHHKGFMGEQIFQLKKMLEEALVSNLSLVVRKVDVSLEYESEGEKRVIGAELGEVNIKQRMVISHGLKSDQSLEEQELLCTLEDVSVYLGISSEQSKIETKAKNKEILHRIRTIKKVYLMQRNRIEIYYNLQKKAVAVEINQINLKISKLTIVELIKILEYLNKHISSRPILRPGQGQKTEVSNGKQSWKMKEGTLKWWDYTLSSVMDKIVERRKNNFFGNHQYHKYLYFLYYKYTFGANNFVKEQMQQYEKKKLARTTMEIYFTILSRIALVRESKKYQVQQDNFIKFLQCSPRIKKTQEEHKLKNITYEDIRKSKVYFNLQNCRAYIRGNQFKDNININVSVDTIKINIVQNKFDLALIDEGFKLPPSVFYSLKLKYISKYYKSFIEHQSQGDKLVLLVELSRLQIVKSRIEMKVVVPSVLVLDQASELILKVRELIILKQNNSILSERNTVILEEKGNYLKINSIFLNIQQATVRHLLTIWLMMNGDLTMDKSEQRQFQEYFHNHVYKKLSMHPSLQTYSGETTNVECEKITIVTALFTENQYLTIEVGGVNYSQPANVKPRILIRKMSISRSRISNINRVKYSSLQKLQIQKQSILMQNNKPLIIILEKIMRQHFVNSQQKQKKAAFTVEENSFGETFKDLRRNNKKFTVKEKQLDNKKDIGYIYFENVIDIVVPFLLVQLSFLDVMYFHVLLNYWKQITDNPYFFPKKKAAQQRDQNFEGLSDGTIHYLEHEHKFTRSGRSRCKLEGIEIILYGQSMCLPEHRILSMMLEGVIVQDKQYILGHQTTVSFLNLYIQNCLGNRVFNSRRLPQILDNPNSPGQPLIYPAHGDTENVMRSHLVLYGVADETKQRQLLKGRLNSQLDITKLSKNTCFEFNINALFIYQSPEFFQIIHRSLKVIDNIARSKSRLPRILYIDQEQNEEDHEILQTKRITQSQEVNGHISRMNIIVIHQSIPVYTISLLNIDIKHVSELFVGKYHIKAEQAYVVDISINCGLHPIVFRSKQLNAYLTLYQSQMLKKKQNKQALVDIHVSEPEIYYLNRKIMEMLNFFMGHFTPQREEEDRFDFKDEDRLKNTGKSYPFCYKLELSHPMFIVLRSSLSHDKFVGEGSNIVIHNLNDENAHETNFHETFFGDSFQQFSHQDSFESCVEIKDVEIKFYPFTKEEEEEIIKQDVIKIFLNDINLFPEHSRQRAVVSIPQVVLAMANKELNAEIKQLECNLTYANYQLLIRFTQQNFCERPVSFPKNIIPTQQKFLDFRTKYKIDDILLRFRQNEQSPVFGQMNLKDVDGTNAMFTNTEMQDEIYIGDMHYDSLLFNNDLETIISRKQKHFENSQANNLLFDDSVTRVLNKQGFHNHQYFNEEHEDDDKKMNQFFVEDQEGNFKFQQLQCKHQGKDQSQMTEHLNEGEQETNIEKVGKWLGGMCQKCLCCLKNKADTEEHHEESSEKELKKVSKEKKLQSELIPKLLNHFRFFQSFIELEEEIIDFEKKVNVKEEHKNVRSESTIYLHMVSQKSKQKRIYILLQDLNIYYEKNKHIMTLSNFLGKPYMDPPKPPYVRDANFNNFRPFQTLVEMVNSSVEVFHRDGDDIKSIILDLNMTYKLEKKGDILQGPGRKTMSVDVIFDTFFYNSQKTVRQSQLDSQSRKIPLSNTLRIIWQTEARKKQYHERGPLSNKQKLLFCALGKRSEDDYLSSNRSNRSNSKNAYYQDDVKLNLPISSLKEIKELCQKVFLPSQQKKASHQAAIEKKLKKKHEKQLEEREKEKRKKRLDMFNFQSRSYNDRMFPQVQMQLKRNKTSDYKERESELRGTQAQLQKDLEGPQFTTDEKRQSQARPIEPSKNLKVYFIPRMAIDVETKIKTSYIRLYLNDIHYKILQCMRGPKLQANNQLIDMQANIDYLNLNIVKFEPLLQPAIFHVNIENYLTNNSQISKTKFISKAEKDQNAKDYIRGLSINVSTALFHTYKQLQLKYQLANEDMEFWSEKCFDLTTKNTEVYEVMLRKNDDRREDWMHREYLFQSQPSSIELKNFFGKQFVVDNKSQTSKKKSKRLQVLEKGFHYQGLKVFVYHSFLEAKTKLKNIVYRTPFGIMNLVSDKVIAELNFKIKKGGKQEAKWSYNLEFKQLYSIPSDIYEQDFLMSITASKKQKQTESILAKRQSSLMSLNENKLRQTSNKDTVKYQKDMLISVKYLVQMHAKISEYNRLGNNKYSQYLFGNDSLKTRYIDKRDILIRSNNLTLAVINVKTEQNETKQKNTDKIIFYDSLTIIMSPIVIYNFTTINLMVTSCRKNKPFLIPHGQKIQINEFPPGILVQDIAMEFAEDIVHHQYHFLDPNFKVDQKNKQVIKPLLIDRMQSLNLRIIKETYNTCVIEIYPDWVITNRTTLEFQLGYMSNEFPIDRRSCSFLAIEEWRNKNQPKMELRLYDNENPKEDPHEFTAQIDLLDLFTLACTETDNKIKDQIKDQKKQIQNIQEGCCGSSKNEEVCCPDKLKDQNPYRCIEFVMSIRQSNLHEETKQILLNYKYDITNSMDVELQLYQAVGKKHNESLPFQEVLLFKLQPKQNQYLFSYDFLPKYYFVSIIKDNEKYTSNLFNCQAATGGSFSLKLKPQRSVAEMAYIRVDITHIDHTSKLCFKMIDESKVKHPFYIQNRTPYNIKITENEESFKIKPKDANPFVWSDLIDNAHEIRVEAEGVSKEYSLKQKSQFEPIILRGDNFKNHLRKQSRRMLFKKETCKVKWSGIGGQFLVIYDMFAKKLHIKGEDKTASFDVANIDKIEDRGHKLQIVFNNKNVNLQLYPSQQTKSQWYDIISKDIYNDVTDKIHFTIESFQSSMIFFLHSVDISSDNNLKMSKQEYVVENLYISLVTNNNKRVEELLLVNMEDIQYTNEEKMTKIMESDGRENLNVKRNEECFQIKKLKINNQLLDAVNPVILSQIKKSKHPFLQFKRQRQNLVQDQNEEKPQQIDHYKSIVFFLDEAELMVEASLFPKLMDLKKYIDQIQDNYRLEKTSKVKLSSVEGEGRQSVQRKQFYINLLEIKPIKMTVSVNFESQTAYYSSTLMNFLTMIPAGVENAIIEIDSYIFHHVFLQQELIKKTLNEYYLSEMKKQIIYNTGSIQFLAPLQLIQGLGVGVKNIFYNPFYELVSKQEVQSFASALIEGFISLVIYLFTKGFQFISIIIKLIAFLTFDRTFQSKRQMFRKQIFKSPIDGFNYGGRQFLRVVKELFVKFCQWPCQYHRRVPVLGLLFGIMLCILNIIPWVVKVQVSLFDFIYVIGLGFINWGYYEENSMKERSRPIRTFPYNELRPYDYLTAKGNEIMRKNQIQQNDSQACSYVGYIEEENDQSKYLVLSNYRILYCTYQLLSFKQVQLYKIASVQVVYNGKQNKNQEKFVLVVSLSFPDKQKYFCLQANVDNYRIKFNNVRKMKHFLGKLESNMEGQNLQFHIDVQAIEEYERGNRKMIEA